MKKTLFAAAAFAVAAASPAFAQSYDPDVGSGNLGSWPYTSNADNPYWDRAQVIPYGAYASEPSYGFDPYYGAGAPAPVLRHRHYRSAR